MTQATCYVHAKGHPQRDNRDTDFRMRSRSQHSYTLQAVAVPGCQETRRKTGH